MVVIEGRGQGTNRANHHKQNIAKLQLSHGAKSILKPFIGDSANTGKAATEVRDTSVDEIQSRPEDIHHSTGAWIHSIDVALFGPAKRV